MAKFCGNCGSPLNETALFCGGCGTRVAASPAAPAAQPVAASARPFSPPAVSPVPPSPAFAPVRGYTPGTTAPAVKRSNTLLKVLVAVLIVLFIGAGLAAAGIWYAARKVKEKAAAMAAQSPGLHSLVTAVGEMEKSAGQEAPAEFKGDPRRFLSAQEVSQAIGVPIIRTEGTNAGCTYFAKGDPAEMTARHLSAMTSGLAGPGMDAKAKKTMEQLAGGLFAQQEKQELSEAHGKQEAPVLVLDFEAGNALALMRLSRASFNHLTGGSGSAKGSGTGDLDGIGDEAYLAGGSMLMFRKGDTMARFTYINCPCSSDKIEPLARLAASRM